MNKIIFRLLLFSFVFYTSIFPQNKGGINGKIIDAGNKQPLFGANVTLLNTNLGASTDENGYFVINGVEEGIYKLKVSFIGYINFIKPDVRIVRDKILRIEDVELTGTAVEGEEVTVTAGVFQDDPDALSFNYNYTKDEILRTPGAGGDIFRAIETLPGVSSSGGEFSAFSVRGGSPQENLFIIDDIPFPKVNHMEGGGTETEASQGGRFGIFAPGLIESADFQPGGFSSAYGDKNASLLKLNIKEGNTEDFSVDARYDLIGQEVNYNGPIPYLAKTGAVVSVRHHDFKKVLELIDEEYKGHARFVDIITKITSEPNPQHKISLLGIYTTEKYNRSLDHIFKEKEITENSTWNSKDDIFLGGINWRYLTSPNSFIKTIVYSFGSERSRIMGKPILNFKDNNKPPQNEVIVRDNLRNFIRDEYVSGLKTEFNLLGKNSSLIVGTDISTNRLDFLYQLNGRDTLYVFDADDYRPDPQKQYLILEPEKASYNKKLTYIKAALFAQYAFELSENFNVISGLRYEYSEFNKENLLAPRVSLRYNLDSKTTLNAAAGIYHQLPFETVLASAGNLSNIKKERAYHFILGAKRYITDELKLAAEVYYKKLDKLLTNTDRTTHNYNNNGLGYAYGADLTLIKRFTDKLYWQLTYSYGVSKRKDAEEFAYYNSDFNKTHNFNALLGYQFNEEWSASIKWKYATGNPTDSYILHKDVHNDEDFYRYSMEIISKNSRRLPESHTLNLRIDYRKQIGKFAVITFLDILNVYGHLNPTEEKFLERTGSISYEGFRMIPTFGAKIEF